MRCLCPLAVEENHPNDYSKHVGTKKQQQQLCVCVSARLYLFFCSRDDNAHAFDTDIISEPLLGR